MTKEVADALALEQYEAFNAHRLKKEAEAEAFADDEALNMSMQCRQQNIMTRLSKEINGNIPVVVDK